MKKKWFSIVTLMVLGLVLVACGNAGQSGSSNSRQSKSYEQIEQDGKIRVATEGTYSPFTYHDDNNKLVGYDVEVAEAIADYLGLEVEYVEAPWDGMLSAFDAGQADVVFNQVAITDERKEKYLFTEPYTVSKGALIVKDDNEEVQTFEDLEGKQSAHSVTSNWADVARGYGAEIVSVGGFNEAIELILSGRADATVNDTVTFYDFKKQQPDAPVKIADEEENPNEMAAMIKKDNPELQEKMNEALEALRADGTLTKISEKYFGTDVSQ